MVEAGSGGISFLKTVNTLQMALQKHKGGDGPSKHEVHLQRCQESPREHMPHNRGRVRVRVKVKVRASFVMRMFSSKIDFDV